MSKRSLNPFGSFVGDRNESTTDGYAAVTLSDDDDLCVDSPTAFTDEVDDSPDVVTEAEINDGKDSLRPGDHVYVWRSFGVPRAYQRHGIVLSVDPTKVDALDAVTVVSFYRHLEDRVQEQEPLVPQQEEKDEDEESSTNSDEAFLDENTNTGRSQSSNVSVQSLRNFAENSSAKVHKVQYGSGVAKRLLRRAGTVTACVSDDHKLVLSRVHYLLDHPATMPKFQVLSANGECAAVWCKLGRWCSLQGSSILEILAVGQAGGAAAGGFVASNLFFLVPMPGLWGMVGFWWYVPATVLFPMLMPILVTFGLLSIVPLEILRRFRKKWKQISFRLNHEFWSGASQEIKEEFFAATTSADEDWMRRFFGMREDEEEDRGRYMPLDTTEDFEDENEDEDMIERHREHVAACYNSGSGAGQLPTEKSFLQQVGSMRQNWNRSWTNFCNKNKTSPDDSTAVVPLTTDTSDNTTSPKPQGLSWTRSWTSRDNGERESLRDKFSGSFARRSVKESARITPDLELLDDEKDVLL